jgi:glycosyltransferase involved in cell wall biosynthesis
MDRLLGSPDLVYGTNYVVPPTRCPQLVAVYDCWFLEHPQEAHPDVRLAAAVLHRAVANGADVVCSSQATADRVRHFLGTDRIHTIHLGPPPAHVDEPTDRPDPRASFELRSKPYILALGTIERRKNVPALVVAFGRLANELPDVRLVIAGRNGDDSAAVKQAIDALPRATQARVTILGSVDERDKRELLTEARVLAYPSLDEGFGFPILEAQLAQTPVVATSAGSIPEVAGRGALLSSPDDRDALTVNLHRALTDDETRRRIVACGTENVGRFSWEANANATVDLIHHIVERL